MEPVTKTEAPPNALRLFLTTLGYAAAPEDDKPAKAWLANHKGQFDHFINGQWQPPKNGAYFPTTNPATGEKLSDVAMGSVEDVNAAVAAAEAAYPAWKSLTGFRRAQYLYAIARAIAKHSRLFAVLESLDNGKTIRETRDIDIPLVVRHFYAHAGWAAVMEEKFPGHEAGGVIAQIIPWNFPLLMLAWKIAPALAAGNTVVLKPAEFTPLTALLFAEILRDEVGLPPGVVNIVTGDGTTGEALVKHPLPWKIAFTGSTEVGQRIRQLTAGSGKRLTMELGGKSPLVVFPDADIDGAIEGIVDAIWFNQGQVCCAGSRLLVHESIAELVIARLKRRMETLRGGDSLDKTMDMGAINSAAQFTKITDLIKQGQSEGAVCWQPQSWVCPTVGYFIPPTLITGVQPASTLAQVEIFGPVLVVMTFRTPDEAVALANNTPYGLAASVWTQDSDTLLDMARRIKAGTVWGNCTNQFDASSGFGGYRMSGFGREGGAEGFLDVLVEKFEAPPERPTLPATTTPVATTIVLGAVDRTFRFFVDGKLARPDGGNSYHLQAPSGALLGTISDANRKDVRNAVQAARKAADAWGRQSAHGRAQLLYFLAENLASEAERFTITLQRTGLSLEEAGREVMATIERLFYWAGYADKFGGEVQSVPGSFLVAGIREPVGVMGLRAPDEYPLLGFVSTLAPALAMGNTVVVVPGRQPMAALDLMQVIMHSEFPAGVINILTGKNPDKLAELLANHMDVDGLWSFSSKESACTIEHDSACNMKRTWVGNGRRYDWSGAWGKGRHFLRQATHIKNVWLTVGA